MTLSETPSKEQHESGTTNSEVFSCTQSWGHQLCVPGMPSPTELKTVGDDSCFTLEEEEDTMRLYGVCLIY